MWRTLAVATVICALAIPAGAQHRGHGWGGDRHIYHHDGGGGWYNPLGSVLGGIVGGWIGSQATRPGRQATDVEGDLEPWSKAWFGYCTNRYRSFDPETGRYYGYDGEYHFCH